MGRVRPRLLEILALTINVCRHVNTKSAGGDQQRLFTFDGLVCVDHQAIRRVTDMSTWNDQESSEAGGDGGRNIPYFS